MAYEKDTFAKKIAMRISVVTIIVNVVLALFKLIAGVVASSYALISDSVHSASDDFSTVVVIIGINIASKTSDEKHQFGHDRFECVAAILLAFALGVTGGLIGFAGVKSMVTGAYKTSEASFTGLALIAAISSIVVKEAMYWYTRSGAKKTGSGALMADAWHHRSDALSSIGSVIALVGIRYGLPILDPIASVIICVFVVRAAVMIFCDAIAKMTDEALAEDQIDNIEKIVESVRGVERSDSLKTRKFGDKSYVEVEIAVDYHLTLLEAHDIAETVHDAIENGATNVIHCVVHVNPLLNCGKTDCRDCVNASCKK